MVPFGASDRERSTHIGHLRPQERFLDGTATRVALARGALDRVLRHCETASDWRPGRTPNEICGTSQTGTDTAQPAGHLVTIGGGRALGVVELGDSQGRPILYFHGCPGSRLEAGVLARAASQAGARLIAVDRPGMGLSPAQPGRQVLDWPADVARLADSLGLDRFAILGFSGGGPYAAACALRIPDRLNACGLVAAAGPARRSLSVLAHGLPDLVIPLVRPFIRDRRAMAWWMRRVLWLARQPDRTVFKRPEIQMIVVASIVEALRQGSSGVAREVTLLGEPWGFELEDIAMPVQLWHGEADAIVPVRVGRATASRLPHVTAVFVPGEAHKSLLVNRGPEILATLLARGSTQESSDGSRAGH